MILHTRPAGAAPAIHTALLAFLLLTWPCMPSHAHPRAHDARGALDTTPERGARRTDPEPHWLALHRSATVVDGHNDFLGDVMHGRDITRASSKGHSDLPRFALGGVDVQLASVWIPTPRARRAADARAYADAEIDSLRAIARRSPSRLRIATTRAGIDSAVRAGTLAAVVAFEGADPIEGMPARLAAYYSRGLRVLAPVWDRSVGWATTSKDESAHAGQPGLTAVGRTMVRCCDSLGIVLDVSHLSARSIADLLASTRNPVLASHSSCAALRAHRRNLTDEQIRAIAAGGGVVMVNFFPSYLRAQPKDWRVRTARYKARIDALDLARSGFRADLLARYDTLVAQARRENLGTILDIADHIDHVVRTAGADHAGIGSDFDGVDLEPVGMSDVTLLPLLTRELVRRGYPDADIRNILGGNALRVCARVWR